MDDLQGPDWINIAARMNIGRDGNYARITYKDWLDKFSFRDGKNPALYDLRSFSAMDYDQRTKFGGEDGVDLDATLAKKMAAAADTEDQAEHAEAFEDFAGQE